MRIAKRIKGISISDRFSNVGVGILATSETIKIAAK
jgi:hypothetical protein